MQEEREKAGEGRLERNRRWRQRKEAPPSSAPSVCSSSKELEDIQEEKLSRRREPSERRQDEKEARREKNKEWRWKKIPFLKYLKSNLLCVNLIIIYQTRQASARNKEPLPTQT